MMRCWPDLSKPGWHVEVGWMWDCFGLVLCGNGGPFAALVMRVGWAYVQVWRHRREETEPWLYTE